MCAHVLVASLEGRGVVGRGVLRVYYRWCRPTEKDGVVGAGERWSAILTCEGQFFAYIGMYLFGKVQYKIFVLITMVPVLDKIQYT